MDKTFQCTVVAPPGKIIDCQAASVVFPAHDGMVGVLADHMPMFCELGLGMMEIDYVSQDEKPSLQKASILIDQGFSLIGQNHVTIVSNDAYSSIDIKKEKIERAIDHIKKKIASGAYTPAQQEHETEKTELLKKLLEPNPSNKLDITDKTSG